jgi:hypothetical protein
MRWVAISAGLMALWAGAGPSSKAGVYNTAELPSPLSRKFSKFKETLIPLRQIGSAEVDSPLNRRYALVAQLAAAGAPPALPVEQRLDLSAYLIRALKAREAVSVLTPPRKEEEDNFVVLASLATAELLDRQPLRAAGYQADALRRWPKEYASLSEEQREWLAKIGWKERDFNWFREVETYQLRLVRLRARESIRPTSDLPDNVDALFGEEGKAPVPPRFVGDSGRFEAGKLAAAERAKLPANAIDIVEQLLVWMPHDMRLYWLLGELFNAEGDVSAAKQIFEEIVVKWNPQASKTTSIARTGFQRDPTLPPLFKQHLEVLRAQPHADVTVAEAALTPTPAPAPGAPDPAKAAAPVDWQSLGIGFGAGLLVALFGYWQVREVRRRRQTRTVTSRG